MAEQQPPPKLTKLIVAGESGTGKTGALASLASAGYKLWMLDTDSGVDTLHNVLRDEYPQVNIADSVRRVPLTQEFKVEGVNLVPEGVKTWRRLQQTFIWWDETPQLKLPDGREPWIYTLGAQDVLCLDTLTGLANLAKDLVLCINGRAAATPQLQDWRDGQEHVQRTIRMLTSDKVKCNVVVNAHIEYISREKDGPEVGYPATLGKALSPKIGSTFNSVLLLERAGVGRDAPRWFYTNPRGVIEAKNAAPFSVREKYPIKTGLADFFMDVQNGKGANVAPGAIKLAALK